MKKLLIIAVVVLLAVPALADPGWFMTGPRKTECTVPVKMVIPFFFSLVEQPTEIMLLEIEGTPNWEGNATWYFINNTPVTLTATLDPTGYVAADHYLVCINNVTSYTDLTTHAGYAALPNPFPPHAANIWVKLVNVAYFDAAGTTKTVAYLTVTITAP
jgi:hypothetical protein